MRIKAKEIARSLRLEGVQLRGKDAILASRTWSDLQEALDANVRHDVGAIQPECFSLRDLAAQTIFGRDGEPVGDRFVEDFFGGERCQGRGSNGNVALQEAMGAIDSSAFAGITGQLVINRMLEAFTSEDFVLSKLIPTFPTTLNGERIPGVSLPKDPGEDFVEAEEMQELNYLGSIGETYVQTPVTVKRQLGVAVTKEAVFFDRTGLVLDRARTVGQILGLRKEKNLIGVFIGAQNPYAEKRQGDSTLTYVPTYLSSADSGRWVNHIDNLPLTDWTDINQVEQQFSQMVDPDTGEPIILPGERILVAPQMQALTANQLLLAQTVWKATNGGIAPTGGVNGVATIGANPLNGLSITLKTSRQLMKQIQQFLAAAVGDASGYWWYGDPAAFAYMENWPITVTQAPQNSEAEFSQDIMYRFKASERGVAAVMQPRKIIRCRGGVSPSTPGTSGTNASISSSSGD